MVVIVLVPTYRIEGRPDLSANFISRFASFVEAHAAEAQLPSLGAWVIDECPPASTVRLDDRVQPFTVGVVSQG